ISGLEVRVLPGSPVIFNELASANFSLTKNCAQFCATPGAKPDDRITLHASIAFDPQLKCPRWDRFLAEIFDGNCELVSYVHRAVGYSLTGQTSEQCFFCCYGEGANGKSRFLNVIAHALGSY